MATHRKTFRFRMRPTKGQEQACYRMAGACRWVWNWGLARKNEHYKATGKNLTYNELASELTALKNQPETMWLKEADAQALQQTLKNLDQAFSKFFKKQTKYPKFKSRKRDTPRFRIPQRVKVEGDYVVIPKIGKIRIFKSQDVDLPTKSATFKRNAIGHWYVTLIAEFEMPDVPLSPPDPSKTIGIDLGLIDFAILSDESKPTPAPKFFRKGQRKLKRAQRKLSRAQLGSKRRSKAKFAVAKIHQNISNKRSDFLHKLTTDLVNNYDANCIEDLCLKGLVRTKLGKSFSDASMGEFRRQLEYKSEWNRKHLVVIGRFFPSSKMCNSCKAINRELELSDRMWTCSCGAVLDRDLNAARNIHDEGLRILGTLAVGQTDNQNAHGQTVRLA